GLDSARVWQVKPWAALNNSNDSTGIADAVALREADGTPCERVPYSASGVPSGVPLELREGEWRPSRAPLGTPLAPPRTLAPLATLAFLLRSVSASAQDFASPAPPGSFATPAIFLEHGLPALPAAPAVEAVATSWYGMPELATRAVALCAGWRSARAAAGISRTGGSELGWTTAAFALGVAAQGGGG